ncbi:hypothetical protein ABZ896_52580 [Streptomyces sp. NPDC047072]|uniref:hypothetical protein n=1 Tax=Streptomyces sp. NPDC047072 TaxID=3154809 RepID=UPI0033EB8630
MTNHHAPWRFRACAATFLVSGVTTIVASLLDQDPWWSWLPHLLLGTVLVALAILLFMATGGSHRPSAKKRSLPPL